MDADLISDTSSEEGILLLRAPSPEIKIKVDTISGATLSEDEYDTISVATLGEDE